MAMGQAVSMYNQMFPGKKTKFNVEDVPDLSGKVIIVTGGNAGIGKQIVKVLLEHNAKVYMASRDKTKALKAIDELKDLTGAEAHFLELDLADLKKVKKAAEEFRSKETRLDVLYNNGGVMTPPMSHITAQGYDQQMGVNVLGPFLFTKLLLPTLLSTPGARVVTTSSGYHLFVKSIDYKVFREGKPAPRTKMGAQGLYSLSKFANVVFANELARRYGPKGLQSVSLNPGNIQSELQRHMGKVEGRIVTALILYPTPFGALSPLYAGTMPEAGRPEMNGAYFIPWAKTGAPNAKTRDVALGEELWAFLEGEVKEFVDEN